MALLPGRVPEHCDGTLWLRRHARVRHGSDEATEGQQAERLESALREAGRRWTSDPARHGLMLSGGIASRVVAAVASRPMPASTLGDRENREARTARRVAQAAGWAHRFLRRTPDHCARILESAVELSAGMVRFDHCQFLGLPDEVHTTCDAVFVEEPLDALFKGPYWKRTAQVKGIHVPVPLSPRHSAHEDPVEAVVTAMSKSIYSAQPWRIFREPWRGRYEDVLRALGPSLFHVEEIHRIVAEHLTGRRYNMRLLFSLLGFGEWFRQFGAPVRV